MSSTNRGQRGGGGDDFFVTPAWSVHRLLEEWRPIGDLIVEPSAGNGAIIRAVNQRMPGVSWLAVEKREEERGALVAANATVAITDFLSDDTLHSRDVFSVIGNPPFLYAMEFIERAKRLYPSASIAFLLRLNFAAGGKRARFMRETKPSVYVLPNRPSFQPNGKTDSIEYAWFVWDKNELNRGTFHVLKETPVAERSRRRSGGDV